MAVRAHCRQLAASGDHVACDTVIVVVNSSDTDGAVASAEQSGLPTVHVSKFRDFVLRPLMLVDKGPVRIHCNLIIVAVVLSVFLVSLVIGFRRNLLAQFLHLLTHLPQSPGGCGAFLLCSCCLVFLIQIIADAAMTPPLISVASPWDQLLFPIVEACS